MSAGCGSTDESETSRSSSFAAKRGKGSSAANYVPMTVEYEDLQKRWASSDPSCFGVDDRYEWAVVGSLAPGESYTFDAVPVCDYAELPAIMVRATWDASTLEVSSVAPADDGMSGDSSQAGTPIAGASSGNEAQLCMFTSAFGAGEGFSYTVTIRNTGTETAYDVRLEGVQTNGWLAYFHNPCSRADADGDGWNDSLERGMQVLTYYASYADPGAKHEQLDGTNYLAAKSFTAIPYDEADSYPPDVDDDGVVDGVDVAVVEAAVGQGTGVSLDMIDSNPGPRFVHEQAWPWRRYDLNGDGWVDARDVEMVQSLVGLPIPAPQDVIAPSVEVRSPTASQTMGRATYVLLEAYAFDESWLERVEFSINGKLVCSADGRESKLARTHQYACWWETPNKRGTYELTARAYDRAGHTSTHATSITVQ